MTPDALAELAAQGYNHVPFTREVFADLDTPLSCYIKVARGPYSYLLESDSQGGGKWSKTAFGRAMAERFTKEKSMTGAYRNKVIYSGIRLRLSEFENSDISKENDNCYQLLPVKRLAQGNLANSVEVTEQLVATSSIPDSDDEKEGFEL